MCATVPSSTLIQAPQGINGTCSEHQKSVEKTYQQVLSLNASTSPPLIALKVAECTPLGSMCRLIADYAEPTTNWERYQLLVAENDREEPRQFVTPARRICGQGRGTGVCSQLIIETTKNAIFIKQDDILQIHPMRFLHSPFPEKVEDLSNLKEDHPLWEDFFDDLAANLLMIAITQAGKHVILQQACRSCLPTCVAMLVLDRGKAPNYDLVQTINLATNSGACKWIKEAGLNPKETTIPNDANKAATLQRCLAECGPGILFIYHPILGSHAIILDAISIDKNSADIRDPFHGWSLTMRLDSLLSWFYNDSISFIQITGDLQQSPPA